MTKLFEGICIGGPADGRVYVHGSPSLTLAEREAVSFVPADAADLEQRRIKSHHYSHKQLMGEHGAIYGLFVHQSVDDFIGVLVDSYRREQ